MSFSVHLLVCAIFVLLLSLLQSDHTSDNWLQIIDQNKKGIYILTDSVVSLSALSTNSRNTTDTERESNTHS